MTLAVLCPAGATTEPSHIGGMFFIQNHLKPVTSVARIRDFSAGNETGRWESGWWSHRPACNPM